jgi:hypothetical protein
MKARLLYLYRLHCGWLPVQFCMECGRPFWAGFPRWWFVKHYVYVEEYKKGEHPDAEFEPVTSYPRGHVYKWEQTWQGGWQDMCSLECSDADMKRVDSSY